MASNASFAASFVSNDFYARTSYRVRPSDLSKVICHRRDGDAEIFLVQWRTAAHPAVPPGAICSWHTLDELASSLHHVQTYVETLTAQRPYLAKDVFLPPNRKRKSPGSDPLPRDGLPTPGPSDLSRETSVLSSSSASSVSEAGRQALEVYNGALEKKAGRITAKKSRDPNVLKVNASRLPTVQMLEIAASTPVSRAEHLIREAFFHKLRAVKAIRLENDIDSSTPSLDFTFINEFVLRDGVVRADPETNGGCQNPCRPNMGQHIGCEYAKQCTCLEYAAVNEQALEREDPHLYRYYMQRKQQDSRIDTDSRIDMKKLPKRFPYQKAGQDNRVPSTLQTFYRESRNAIYECNPNCNCGPVCKSRLVQKGRKVPLTIFKTLNRGWGVKCDEDLIQGEFIDTYLGEVITNEEADRREAKAGKDKASYLYSLDKFVNEENGLTEDDCYVVDGQHMGGPTRFINHCCEPNCRQYTVSYNKYDFRIYDLAFFAIENIPAGKELTFDYMDKDEEEEEDVIRKREVAANDPENTEKKPCNCGARKCRGSLWV